jgi:hypothetical protein
MHQAARCVLRDYIHGKIVYHTAPPIMDEEMDDEEDVGMTQ